MLATLALIGAMQASEQSPVRVGVSDLLGHTPAEVGRLSGAAGEVIEGEGVRIVDGERTVIIYSAERFHRAWPEDGFCVTGFPEVSLPGQPDPNPRMELMRRSQAWFVFENGVLTGVHPQAPAPPRADANRPATRQSLEASMLAPKPPSPMTVS